jgi:hypothetical protein
LRSPFPVLLDVRRYQIVHERDGGLRIRVVPTPGARGDLPERVAAAVVHQLEEAGVAAPQRPRRLRPRDERETGHAAKLKLVTSAR